MPCLPSQPDDVASSIQEVPDHYSPTDSDVPFIDATFDTVTDEPPVIHSIPPSLLNANSRIQYPSPRKMLCRLSRQYLMPPSTPLSDKYCAPAVPVRAMEEPAPPAACSLTPSCSSHSTEPDSQFDFGSRRSSSEVSAQSPAHVQRQRSFMSTPRAAMKTAPVLQLQSLVTPIRHVRSPSVDEGHCEGDDFYDDIFCNSDDDERTASLNHSQYDNITADVF